MQAVFLLLGEGRRHTGLELSSEEVENRQFLRTLRVLY